MQVSHPLVFEDPDSADVQDQEDHDHNVGHRDDSLLRSSVTEEYNL